MSRRSLNPVVRLKYLIAHVTTVIEYCHRCGVEQPLVWHVDDTLWQEVADDWDVLCPKCFDELAAAKGHFMRWTPNVL